MGETGSELVSRNGTSMLETRNGSVDSRSIDGRSSESRNGAHDARQAALDAAAPIASSIPPPQLSEAAIRDLNELTEPVFSREPWLDQQAGSLVDHPLLRGLLMELPPKGAMPQPEYLDRWFEAARSILDLLYTMSVRS